MTDELVGEVAPAQRFDEEALANYLERQIESFGRQSYNARPRPA